MNAEEMSLGRFKQPNLTSSHGLPTATANNQKLESGNKGLELVSFPTQMAWE